MLQKQQSVSHALNNIIVLNNIKKPNPNEVDCVVNLRVGIDWWLDFGYTLEELDYLDIDDRFHIITNRTNLWDSIKYNHMEVKLNECWDDMGDDVYSLHIKMNWLLVMGEDIKGLSYVDKCEYIQDFFGDLGMTGTLMTMSSHPFN